MGFRATRLKDAPREHKCNAPCMGFQWLGCDEKCHENGCEILTTIKVQDVLDMVQTGLFYSARKA